ncbi:MAG: hypothetical protein AB7V32_03540 [Candidatus Berkiella sp.]
MDYIPIKSKKSWKNRFLSYHSQHIQKNIQRYEEEVLTDLKSSSAASIKRLQSAPFWEDLKVLSPNKDEVDEIHELWKKIKPLAHLNTKQLLVLLQQKVLPLEQEYKKAIRVLENEKLSIEGNDFWPSHWFHPAIDQQIEKIRKNQEGLTNLKTAIFEGFLWRCQAHSILNSVSQVDDIVSAICIKINKLELLKHPFDIPQPYSSTLNDDRRLAIYDYLEASTLDKDELQTAVLSPLTKQGYATFKTAAQVKKDLEEIRKFNKRVIKALSDNGINNFLFPSWFKKIVPSIVKRTTKNILQAAKEGLETFGLVSFAAKLWSLRYLFYLALTLISYHYLMIILQPVGLIIGATAFAMLSSVLFYTFALSPVWIFGWMMLTTFKQSVVDYITHWKREELYQALDTLVSIQEFMANHLSQVIVDISHFDIKYLSEQSKIHFDHLGEFKSKLNQTFTGQKIFGRGNFNLQLDAVKAKIDTQEKQLKTHLKQVANHIALRVGDDIELLEKSASKDKLVPTIPHSQLAKLKEFVAAYGDELAVHQFEQNANPIHKWFSKIERCSRVNNDIEYSFKQPWGGHELRKDYLKGWQSILRGYLLKKETRQGALHINELLEGKIYPTLDQVKEWIKQLEIGGKGDLLLRKVQSHIFKTLNSNNHINARLLHQSHKELVSQWYRCHKVQIKRAEEKINCIFKIHKDDQLLQKLDEIGDEVLSDIYELLDGADVYSYSSKQDKTITQRKNLARQFFENYEGDSSRAIRLLRFLPEEQKSEVLIGVAKKRLTWLLAHLDKLKDPSKPFDDADIELFHDYRLLEASEKFEFNSFVSQSEYFNNPWDPKVERFLDASRRNGLDTGKLVRDYKDKNHKIKPFILHQHSSKKAAICRKEAENLSNPSKRGGIYVGH